MCQNSDTPPGDMKGHIQSETDLAHRAAAAFDYDGTGSRLRHPTSGNVEVFGGGIGVGAVGGDIFNSRLYIVGKRSGRSGVAYRLVSGSGQGGIVAELAPEESELTLEMVQDGFLAGLDVGIVGHGLAACGRGLALPAATVGLGGLGDMVYISLYVGGQPVVTVGHEPHPGLGQLIVETGIDAHGGNPCRSEGSVVVEESVCGAVKGVTAIPEGREMPLLPFSAVTEKVGGTVVCLYVGDDFLNDVIADGIVEVEVTSEFAPTALFMAVN